MPEPDLLLLVAADVSALDRQIQNLRARLDLSNVNLEQPFQRATAAAQETSRQIAAAGDNMNALNQRVQATDGSIRKVAASQKELGAEMNAAVEFARRLEVAQAQAARENEALVRRQGVTQATAIQENERLIQRQGVTQSRALQENEALIQRQGVTQSRALQENEALIRRQGVTQARATQDNIRLEEQQITARLNQLRTLESFTARMSKLPAPGPEVAQQLENIRVANERVTAGAVLSRTEMANLRLQMSEVARNAQDQVTGFNRLTNSLGSAAKWAAIFTLEYRALNLLFHGVQQIIETDKQLTSIAATLEQGADRAAVLRASYDLMVKAQTTLGLSAKDAGSLVFELTKTMDANTEKMNAAFIPALALTSIKETDQADTIRVLVGLYNVYGDTLTQAATPAEKFAKIADLLLNASFLSVGSVRDMATAMQFVAGQGKIANTSLEQLLAVATVLQDSLNKGSRSGTGLSRVLQQLSADVGVVARTFKIPIDLDAPINAFEMLIEVVKRIKAEGPATAETLNKIKTAFPNIQEQRALLFLVQNLDMVDGRIKEISTKTGTAKRTIDELSKSVSAAASSLGQELVISIERFLASASGSDPGKMDRLATAISLVKDGVRKLGEAFAFIIAPIGLAVSALDDFNQRLKNIPTDDESRRALRESVMDRLARAVRDFGKVPPEFRDPRRDPSARSGLASEAAGEESIASFTTLVEPSRVEQRRKALADAVQKVFEEQRFNDTDLPAAERLRINTDAVGRARAKLSTAIQEGTEFEPNEEKARKNVEAAAKHLEDLERRQRKLVQDNIKEGDENLAGLNKRIHDERVLEFELGREVALTGATAPERFEESQRRQRSQDVLKVTGVLGETGVGFDPGAADRLFGLVFQAEQKRQNEFQNAQMASSLSVISSWAEQIDVLLEGNTVKTEEEYKKRRGIIEISLAIGLIDEKKAAADRVVLEQETNQKRYNDAVAQAQRIGVLKAHETQQELSELTKRGLAAEAEAGEKIKFIQLEITARSGAQQLMLAYLADEGNKFNEIQAAKIQGQQAVMERHIKTLQTINDAERIASEQQLRLLAERQRGDKDYFGFFTTSLRLAVDQQGDLFQNLESLARSTAQNMRSSFSDFFFNLMTLQFDNLGNVAENFMKSMARSISDFLASQAVTGLFKILGGGFNLLFGAKSGGVVGAGAGAAGFGGFGSGTGVPGVGDEFLGLFGRGETILTQQQTSAIGRLIDAVLLPSDQPVRLGGPDPLLGSFALDNAFRNIRQFLDDPGAILARVGERGFETIKGGIDALLGLPGQLANAPGRIADAFNSTAVAANFAAGRTLSESLRNVLFGRAIEAVTGAGQTIAVPASQGLLSNVSSAGALSAVSLLLSQFGGEAGGVFARTIGTATPIIASELAAASGAPIVLGALGSTLGIVGGLDIFTAGGFSNAIASIFTHRGTFPSSRAAAQAEAGLEVPRFLENLVLRAASPDALIEQFNSTVSQFHVTDAGRLIGGRELNVDLDLAPILAFLRGGGQFPPDVVQRVKESSIDRQINAILRGAADLFGHRQLPFEALRTLAETASTGASGALTTARDSAVVDEAKATLDKFSQLSAIGIGDQNALLISSAGLARIAMPDASPIDQFNLGPVARAGVIAAFGPDPTFEQVEAWVKFIAQARAAEGDLGSLDFSPDNAEQFFSSGAGGARGGRIRAGTGIDDVPLRVTRGETVIPTPFMDEFDDFVAHVREVRRQREMPERPFAESFPTFMADMRWLRNVISEVSTAGVPRMFGRGSEPNIALHITVQSEKMLDDPAFWRDKVRLIKRAWSYETTNERD